MAVHTWTVDELCSAVGDALRAVFPDELWIRGEISGLRRSPAGHLYFDLIEPGATGRGADTRISVVAFRGPLRGIEAVLAKVGNLQLEDGIEVRIRGRIDYYPPQGRVQFLMNAIDPRYTLGQLAADRDEVLRKLVADGLHEANRAKLVPAVPLRVGLVTSDDSAAYNDFIDELHGSGYGFHVVFADARVQGVDAEASLVAAFHALDERDVEVVALVRGGGARTDLVAFDREAVARAVATCAVPVFVGIGHEIDRSVVDEVCHSSLKTPTACAAALVDAVREYDERVRYLAEAISARARTQVGRADERIERDSRLLVRSTSSAVRLRAQGLDTAATRVVRAAQHQLAAADASLVRAGTSIERSHRHLRTGAHRLDRTIRDLGTATSRLLQQQHQRVDAAEALTEALHPDRTLRRGFSITRDAVGRVLRSSPDPDALITTETADIVIDSVVTTASPKEHP